MTPAILTATTILKCYLQINLLLIASYLIYRACRAGMSALQVRTRYLALTRATQVLLVASLVIPIIFSLLPERSLPRIHFEAVRPLPETSVRKDRLRHDRVKAMVPKVEEVVEREGVTVQHLLALLKAGVTGATHPAILVLLLLGCFAMMIRLAVNHLRLRQLIADGIVIRQLGRVVIVVSDSLAVPFSALVGTRAVVVVPSRILANARDFRITLRHELQHHRHGDTAWALLFELGVCVFFANPAIYLWKKQVTELQEFSCDEALIGQRGVSLRDYGSCLISVAEAALGNRQLFVGTACMAAASGNSRYAKSFLRRRIEMFAVHELSRRKNLAIAFGTLSILTTVAVAYGAQQVFNSPETLVRPNAGHAVFDPIVQAIAEDVLRKSVAEFKAKAGFVLVSDPVTGKLLAAANVSGDRNRDRKSWSLSYLLEPASVMKGVITAAAVDRRSAAFDEVFDCENGTYNFGGREYHDWKAFAALSAADTVVHSSNICGMKIGERLGVYGLASTLVDFGFGPGGVTDGFPEAVAGQIPKPGQLSDADFIALLSTGYSAVPGFYINPLEMVHAYGAIANGGKLMKPLGANEQDSAAMVLGQPLAFETARQMKAVLAKVVTDGTGKNAQSALYSTAGKTSTAYRPGSPSHDNLGGERGIAGFVGFAPVDHPRVVVYVGMIDPTNSADGEPHGAQHAAPVFRKVAERVLQHLNVPPDQH